MSRLVLPALILVMFCQSAKAQEEPVPDFRKDINAAVTDTQKLVAYKAAFGYYRNSNDDSCKAYAEEALNLFTEHNYTYGRASALSMLSGAYLSTGMLQMALRSSEESIKLFTELGDGEGVAKGHNNLGVVESTRGRYDVSVAHFLLALNYYEGKHDTAGTVNSLIKLGASNDFNGNYEKALTYYTKALGMALLVKPSANVVYLYNNIGSYYARKGDMDKALENFMKAEERSRNPKFSNSRVSTLKNIGNVYEVKKDLVKAQAYYDEAMALAKEKSDKEEYARLLQLKAAMINGKEPAKAKELLAEALQVSKEIEHKSLQAEVLNTMADIAKVNHEYEQEASYLRQSKVIADSVFNMDKTKEIANLESEYELSKTTTQLTALKIAEARNLQKKNLIIVIAIVLALTLVTTLIFFARGLSLNGKLKRREQDLQKANDVKDRLFSILGHDLKGPIANIPALLSIYDSPDTPPEEKKYILDSIKENSEASIETLEKLLNWGKLQIKGVTLNKSVFGVAEILDNKMRLFKVAATNKNITIVNNVPGHTKLYADENHFKFVMRNLMANAIKYTPSGGMVEINAEPHHEDKKYVIFSVKDDGIGMDEERQQHIFEPYNHSTADTNNEIGNSIGLMLCKEFTKQNGGDIWVKSEKGQGTTFFFSVMGFEELVAS